MEFSRQENWSGLPCPSPTLLRILFEFNTYVATTSVTFLTPLDDVLGVRPCLPAVLSSVPMTGGVDVFACFCIMFSFMSYVCGFFAVSFWKLQGFFTNTEHVSPTRSHAGREPRRKASSSKPVLLPPPG